MYAQTITWTFPQTLTRQLLLATLLSGFGSSFQCGYNLTVLIYPAEFIRNFYNETYQKRSTISIDQSLLIFLWELTVSFFLFGGILGSLLVGPFVDNCGRKGTLLINSVFALISAVLMGCSKALHCYELIIISRLLIGISAGISFCAVPMYLTEIAPENLRGSIGIVAHLFIIFGTLMAQIFSLHKILGNEEGWPILLSLTGFPALFQLLLLPCFPESPRYLLIQMNREEEAKEALKKLRGCNNVEDEMEDLHQEDFAESDEKQMDVLKLFRFPDLQLHIMSVVIMIGGQQLSGINPAQYYAEKIYQSAGLEENIVQYVSIVVSILLMCITVLVICLAQTLELKTILLTGLAICSTTCILLAMAIELQRNLSWMSYISSFFLLIFLIGQSAGPDPVPLVLTAELFLQSSRSTAFVIGGCVHWTCKLVMRIVFYLMQMHIEPYSFLLSWPIGVATLLYVYNLIPPTKNKTFLEIKRTVAIYMTRKILQRDLSEY